MLIDFHTHAFPEKIASKTIKVLEKGIVEVQKSPVLTAKTDGSVSGLLKSMDENFVDISVVLPIATNFRQHTSINAFAKEITNDRIISFGSLHPRQSDAFEILENLFEQGFLGIKLHPEFQEFFVDEDICVDLVKKAKELGLLVVFHSGKDLGIFPPVHAEPKRLANLIDKTGGDNLVLAHMGGFLMWDDVKKYLASSNAYFDTSMLSAYMDKELFVEILNAHSSDKILFGSDSPWENPKDSLEFLKSCNLDKETFEKITYKNAEKLLKLK